MVTLMAADTPTAPKESAQVLTLTKMPRFLDSHCTVSLSFIGKAA